MTIDPAAHPPGKPDLHEPTVRYLQRRLEQVQADNRRHAECSKPGGAVEAHYQGIVNGLQAALSTLDLEARPDYRAAGHYRYHGD